MSTRYNIGAESGDILRISRGPLKDRGAGDEHVRAGPDEPFWFESLASRNANVTKMSFCAPLCDVNAPQLAGG